MKTVGVRDLKNKLSEYLRRVRLGESVLVTDRGEVVAELQPPGRMQGDPSVAGADLYPVLPRRQGGRRHSVAQLLDDERGTR
jgi:prevent-host-death family protein